MRPGRGAQEQRHRADAVGGAGDLTADRHSRTGARAAASNWRAWRAPSRPADRARYREWVAAGYAGEMRLSHRPPRRGARRSAQSAAVGALDHLRGQAVPHALAAFHAVRTTRSARWISRYAWGDDYHDVMRRGLERLDALLRERAGAAFESRICVDTAPLLERSLRAAGGAGVDRQEHLPDQPAAGLVVLPGGAAGLARDRAGRAAARPLRHLHALHRRVPHRGDRARAQGCWMRALCISYFTIELRGAIPEEQRAGHRGARLRVRHLPGRLPVEPARAGDRRSGVRSRARFAPPLEELAAISRGGVPRACFAARR